MPNGWTGKILNVDLTSGATSERDTMPYAREYMGGRGIAARIAWDEIPAGTDAYDPENRVLVMTGPLTGTLAPSSGRTVMASVSPRTYPIPWYTHSTLGGWFGPELKYAGYDGIVVHGKSAAPVCLEIRGSGATLVDARELWGKDTRETQLAIKAKLGARAQILAIGPAGENLVRFATVQHSEENAAGRSGFGAVWGSKNLKAIAVRGTGGVSVADPPGLLREATSHRYQPAPQFADVGRKPGAPTRRHPICSQACTFKCWTGVYVEGPGGRRLPGWCVAPVLRNPKGMAYTLYEGGGIRVPPGVNFEPDQDAHLHELSNTLGMDMWLRINLQPYLVRCKELGVEEIRGARIEPDKYEWFEPFVHGLATRQGLGAIFADGLRRAMDVLEDELPDELVRLGREIEFSFGFPAHREGRIFDHEPLPFWVISAMMHISETREPAIGAHQSSLMLETLLRRDREKTLRLFRRMGENVWGDPDAFQPSLERKAPVTVWSQNQHMIIDCMPLCDFGFPQLMRPIRDREDWQTTDDITGDLEAGPRLFAAVTGVDMPLSEMERMAERAFTVERAILARSGRGRALEETLAPHFALPCKTDGTSVDRAGFLRLMDEYYAARGWDPDFGWPTAEKLEELGLADLVPAIEEARQKFPEAKGSRASLGKAQG